jgi:uroporphyrinogen decarboxylase
VEALGIGLEFVKGDGPVVGRPVRSAADVDRLRAVDVEADLGYVGDSIRAIVKALDRRVPLIGFAGGPFTVASYMIEGGHSKSFILTKRFMHAEPEAWDRLMSRLVDVTLRYLRMQVAAGADAIQLFDSWIGTLTPADYRRFVQPHSRKILGGVAALGVPVIHFGTDTSGLLRDVRDAGGTVIGVDWRIDLAAAWDVLGGDVAVQGNLDPVLFFAGRAAVADAARSILASVSGRKGHIFNLGHGILPETPVDAVADLVKLVRDTTAR